MHKQQDENAASLRKYRIGIIAIFIVATIIAIFISRAMAASESRAVIRKEMQVYSDEARDWVLEQQYILDMFVHVVRAKPEMLDDYEGMVRFLDDVAQRYPQVSAAYIANPDFPHDHPMVMNNGWVPEPDYDEASRDWYKGALATNGIYLSELYYDARTGNFCITFSRTVVGDDGTFYGVFSLDFYIDTLLEILPDSITDTGYAFLLDSDGMIISHPNSAYRLSNGNSVNAHNLPYDKMLHANQLITVRDWDGKLRVFSVINVGGSGFKLAIAKDWWAVYGSVFWHSFIFVMLFGGCFFAVNMVINWQLRWQRRTNDRYKEAAESAIRAEKAKTQFLSNISHELRTPINAVLGMNEMILRESSDVKIRSYATNIQSSGKTLLFLINDILDMSKIESGKMNLVPVEYKPGELAVDLYNVVFLRAQEKGLTLKVFIDPDTPKILYGDDVRIKQIAMNILTNAVKYTHKGGIELTMSAKATGFKTVSLDISVKDTGIGIKKEDMGKLFSSFQRLEEEKNRNIEGAGLGMSITMSLLKQMGGEMHVDSVYQQGSTFSVSIPQRVIDAQPGGDFESNRNAMLHVAQGDEHRIFQAPDAHILVVDDNEMNIAVFKALLSRTKIQVVTADSGYKCLDLVKLERYDIIFMDHMMPDMDGIETLHEIQKLSDSPNLKTPVIALTANALSGAKASYLKEGFTDFLTKPIDGEHLDKMVRQYLPDHLVRFVDEVAPEAATAPSQDDRYLQYGIHVDQGLHYSTNNMDVYLDLVAMFLKDTDRRRKLETFLAEGNMKDYSILAHSLKGNARTLGAEQLAIIAYEHEKESKADHAEVVRSQWEELLKRWETAKEGLALLYRDKRGEELPVNEPDSAAPASPATAEVIELGEALELTSADLAKVAEMIDNFESERAVAKLQEWLGHSLPEDIRDRVQQALTALEDEFDEGLAMKLLKG